MKKFFNKMALALCALAISLLARCIALAWTEPTSTAPAGNVAAPINSGSATQTKTGSFIIGNTNWSQLQFYPSVGDTYNPITGGGDRSHFHFGFPNTPGGKEPLIETSSDFWVIGANHNLVADGYVRTNTGLCIGSDCRTSWNSITGPWTVSGNNIYNNNSGNVGIGTASPAVKLDINGSMRSSADIYTTNGGLGSTINSNEGGSLSLSNNIKTGATANLWKLYNMTGGYNNGLAFWRYFANGVNAGPAMFLNDNGNVGIGTASPGYKLQVNGDIYANGGWLRTSGDAGWYSESYGGGWYMSDTSWIRSYNGKNLWVSNGLLGSNGGLTVGYGGAASPAAGAIIAGNVGIGTASPSTKLDVQGGGAYGRGGIRIGYQTLNSNNNTWLYLGDANGSIYGGQGIAADKFWASSQLCLAGDCRTSWPGGGTISGGVNYISKFTNSNSLGNSQIYDNGSNVGIGTASPTQKLDISGNLTMSGGSREIQFKDAAGSVQQYVWLTGTSLGMGRGSASNSMFVNNAGNVGIGTVNPGAKLDVVGGDINIDASRTIYSRGRMHLYGEELLYILNKSGVVIGKEWGGNGNLTIQGESNTNGYVKTGTGFCIAGDCRTSWGSITGPWTASGANIYNNNSGNVGIGTASPGAKLHVAGNLLLDSTFHGAGRPVDWANINGGSYAGNSYYAYTSMCVNNASGWCDASGGVVLGRTNASATTNFPSNGNSFINAGNVGIGTASPSQKLVVSGNSLTTGIAYLLDTNHSIRAVSGQGVYIDTYGVTDPFFVQQSTGYVGIGTASPLAALHVKSHGSGLYGGMLVDGPIGPWGFVSGGDGSMWIGSNSGNWFVLSTSGNITIPGTATASAFYYTSDASLKKEIASIKDPIKKINLLNGVSFKWKNNGEPSMGLIAQDVEKVFPEAVSTNAETGFKSVDYGKMVAPLIEAVKAQQQEIIDLKSEIDELKLKISQ